MKGKPLQARRAMWRSSCAGLTRSIALGVGMLLGGSACASDQATTEPVLTDPGLPTAALAYSARDLGTLGGRASVAMDINDDGVVVGTSELSGSPWQHAFLWKNGAMTDLGTLGGRGSSAAAINSAGVVVGASNRGDQKLRAFRWQNGTMTGLGSLGGSESQASGINTAGHIVGWSMLRGDPRPPSEDPDEPSPPIVHAFLWRDGRMIDLGTLGGYNSRASDINDDGTVIGESERKNGTIHPFVWKDGIMKDLGALAPAPNGATATAINSRSVIVGFGSVSGRTRSFRNTQGVTTDLGLLGGATYSLARDLNRAGRIVGGVNPQPALRQAFSYKDGNVTLLPAVGGFVGEAFGINTVGDIVGASETTTRWVQHATLWTRQ